MTPTTGTFVRVHNRGGYFRIKGYGFLVNVTRQPLYHLRHHGRHIGPVWFTVLRPDPDHSECSPDQRSRYDAPTKEG